MQYFISDTHFNHRRILDFERGDKFSTLEEHDDFIMSMIEKTVKSGDTLYHLGDFMFGELGDIVKRWKNLPCKTIAIKGNHDKLEKLRELFDEVSDVPLYLARNIVISHEPEPVSEYLLNVHGHLHNSYLDSPNHFCVNIANLDYKLITFKELEKIAGKLPPRNDNFMFDWYTSLEVFTSNKGADTKVLDENGKLDFDATVEMLKNRYDEKTLEDGSKINVKRIAKRKGGENLYIDRDGNNYFGRWSQLEDREIIEKCIATEIYNSKITDRWEKCWVNGKPISKLFPKETDSAKYAFYHIERINE